MGIGKTRAMCLFFSFFCKTSKKMRTFLKKEEKSFTHQDQIGIVRDVARSCAQVKNRFCFRAKGSKSVDICHHIVAKSFFKSFDLSKVDYVNGTLHFCDLFRCDWEAKFFLCFC